MKVCSSRLLVLLATIGFCGNANAESPTDFEAPEVLRVGDEVLNADGALRYPSPAIFDVDGDGKNELVFGTIFGGLYACENENGSEGEPAWTAPKPIESTDGEPLNLENW